MSNLRVIFALAVWFGTIGLAVAVIILVPLPWSVAALVLVIVVGDYFFDKLIDRCLEP